MKYQCQQTRDSRKLIIIVINDALQGCGGVVNNRINKGFTTEPANEYFFIYFFKKVSDKVTGKKVDCVVHFVRLNKTLLKYEDSPDILSMARNSCG